MNANKNIVKSKGGKGKNPYRGKQGKKDSSQKRFNFDNVREDSPELKKILHDFKSKGCNDIVWYSGDESLLKSSASLSTGTILGQDPVAEAEVPGIMVIYHSPSIGSDAIPYAVNQASDAQYSFLVHANSRNYSQDAADYMLFDVAGEEVFSAISDLIRAYGLTTNYKEPNAYMPRALLYAMHFDPDSFIEGRGQLWFAINELIARTRQIWIPNTMPYLQRQYWLNEGVYTDAPGNRSQMYLFVRSHYYMLDETGVDTGTALKPALYTPGGSGTMRSEFYRNAFSGGQYTNRTLYKWEEFVSMISNMIQALADSQDRGQIYGNILAAYGEGKIFALNSVSVDYQVEPLYNAEVLMQIENARPCSVNEPAGFFQLSNGRIVTQWRNSQLREGNTSATAINKENIPGLPSYDGSKTGFWLDPLTGNVPNLKTLNFHFPELPTPAQFMIATRLTMGGTQIKQVYQLPASSGNKAVTPQNTFALIPITSGSEHVYAITFITRDYTGNFKSTPLTDVSAAKSPVSAEDLGNLMAFDWHPFVHKTSETALSDSGVQNSYITEFSKDYGDFDNYTYINDIELGKINNTALYSLFGVERMGR